MTNHGGHSATIELFDLDLDLDLETPRLRHRKSLSDEANLRTPNSIAFINATHMYVTNTHSVRVRSKPVMLLDKVLLWLSKLELKAGVPTGSLSLVDFTTGQTSKVFGLGFANGVELLDQGRTVAVASSNRAFVDLYDISKDHVRPTYLKRIRTPFFPDNLSSDSRGHLYIAGHPVLSALNVMVTENLGCHDDSKPRDECYHAPSWVVEWDPAVEDASSALKNVYVGDRYPSSSTAAYDAERNVMVITGLYADGILTGQK